MTLSIEYSLSLMTCHKIVKDQLKTKTLYSMQLVIIIQDRVRNNNKSIVSVYRANKITIIIQMLTTINLS